MFNVKNVPYFYHTTCESTCDTLSSSAANQVDNTVSAAQGGSAKEFNVKNVPYIER